MTPERFGELREIVSAVLELPPAERQGKLEDACRGDVELLRKAQEMVAADQEVGTYFESAIRAEASAALETSSPLPVPAKIGSYRVVRLLGEGGMGYVYEAEQDQPRRRVALKIIKPGLATPKWLRRFERESEVLGRLRHPGIAQIYEAGTARDGPIPLPYFAMELVNGQDIMKYAAAQALDLRQRLKLMAEICDAVHHAHLRDVIHRDLKPGNILVEETGQAKVLDFGVARVAGGDEQLTGQTDFGQLLGTLNYMSPEQLQGNPDEIDFRTDVYSLGVILYQLLEGRLPYVVKGRPFHEVMQTICNDDPGSLHTIGRGHRGEIGTIVTRALEKEKERRYPNAYELGADIHRFLRDEPIHARPRSSAYNIAKFARRNRVLVAGALATSLALLAGAVATTKFALEAKEAGRIASLERDRALAAVREANASRDAAVKLERVAEADRDRARLAEQHMIEQRRRADQEAANATAISDFLQNDLLVQASPEMQGGAPVRPDPDLKVRTVLDRAAARIDGRFEHKPILEAALQQSIGNTYLRLGLIRDARKHMERALELQRHSLGEDHLETLRSLHNLAWLLQQEKDYAAAEPLQERILAVRLKRLGERHPETMRAMNNLAGSYLGQLKMAKAQPMLERLAKLMTAIRGAEDPATLVVLNNLGIASARLGKFAEAEKIHGELSEVRRRKLGESHPDTLVSLNNRAVAIFAQGRHREGEALHAKVMAARTQVLGEKHPATLGSMANVALAWESLNRLNQAEDLYQRVYDLRRAVLGQTNSDTLEALGALARVRVLSGKFVEAEQTARQVLLAANQGSWHRPHAQLLVGASLAGQKRYQEAEAMFTEGYRGLEQTASQIPVWWRNPALDLARKWIRDMYEAWGRPGQASAVLAVR